MPAFDIDDALTLGGWDARHASPLAVGTSGDVAAALVDSNGDGASIELDLYHWRDGAWEAGVSSGVGSESGDGGEWADGILVSFGHAHPHERVRVRHDGQEIGVTAGETGWWMVLTPADAPRGNRETR